VIVASAMDKVIFVVCVTTVASVGRAMAGTSRSACGRAAGISLQVAAALLVADAATYLGIACPMARLPGGFTGSTTA
jgi:hypothetical protein